MKEIKLKYNEDMEEFMLTDPERAVGKHDFQKHGWKVYMDAGVMQNKDMVEWIAICPRTGQLMYMENGADSWEILQSGFQEAYKKWAKKVAEKVLLGE